MPPRKSDWWLQQTDERVLEYLAADGPATPRVLARAPPIGASVGRLRERCEMLVEAELVAPLADRTYELTRWGRLYLAGDLDVRHQPTPATAREGGRPDGVRD